MTCTTAAVPIIRLHYSIDYHGMYVRVYIPIHLLQAHNTIPQAGSLTNITTETLVYGFYCNQAMAHELVVRYNSSDIQPI